MKNNKSIIIWLTVLSLINFLLVMGHLHNVLFPQKEDKPTDEDCKPMDYSRYNCRQLNAIVTTTFEESGVGCNHILDKTKWETEPFNSDAFFSFAKEVCNGVRR